MVGDHKWLHCQNGMNENCPLRRRYGIGTKAPILFFKRDAAGLDEIQKLVAAMQDPSLNEKVLTQQTRKICEKLNPRMTGKQPIIPGAKAGTALVGGTVRTTEFPWRDYAQKVVLNDAFEGALVVRHGR